MITGAILLIELNEAKRRKQGPWVFAVIVIIAFVSLGLFGAQIGEINKDKATLLQHADKERREHAGESDRQPATTKALQDEVFRLRGDLTKNLFLNPKPQPPVKVSSPFVEPIQGPGFRELFI